MRRAWIVLAAGAVGCELAEVAQPDGEKVLVVQGVMRPDLPQQWVLIEESLTGADPVQSTPGDLPPDRPQLPVVGATVTVQNLSFPADPCGPSVVFAANAADPSISETEGLYWAPPGCPTLRGGDSLALSVQVPGHAPVTGRTEVVGATGFTLTTSIDTVTLPGPVIDFDRDADTIRARIEVTSGRAMQVDIRRATILTALTGATRRVTSVFVDTTAMTLPGTLSDVFTRGTGDLVFHPGAQYQLTLAVADRNYFDFIRSRNGELTGRGFINHLEGGLGVFGSVAAASTPIRVVGRQDDAREGRYRIFGTVRGVQIDTEWDVYLLRSTPDSVSASAFVTGDWLLGPLTGTAGLAEGHFFGDEFVFGLEQEARDPLDPQLFVVRQFTIRGLAQPGTFTVQVVSPPFVAGTLTVTR